MVSDTKSRQTQLAESFEWLTQERQVNQTTQSRLHMVYLVWHNEIQERLNAIDRIELIEKTLLPATKESRLSQQYADERKTLLLKVCRVPQYDYIPYTTEMIQRRDTLLNRLKHYLAVHTEKSTIS